MLAGALADYVTGLLMRHAGLVDPLADQGVVDISHRHQPRRQGDTIPLGTIRIARAVPLLVVTVGDLHGPPQVLGRSQIAVARAQFFANGVEGVAPDFRMQFDNLALIRRKPSRFLQNRIRDTDLADVVQGRGGLHLLDPVRVDRIVGLAQLAGQNLNVFFDPLQMFTRIVVAALREFGHAENNGVLRPDQSGMLFFELARALLHLLLQVFVQIAQLGVGHLQLLLEAAQGQVGVHPGDDLFGLKGLGDIVHRPQLEPFDLVFGLPERRQENNGDIMVRGVGLEAPADLEAIDARHHDVEQDEIGEGFSRDRQGALTVFGHQQAVAAPGEGLGKHLQVGGVVVHHQDAFL